MMPHKISKTFDQAYDHTCCTYTTTDAFDVLAQAGAHEDFVVRFSYMEQRPKGVIKLAFQGDKVVRVDDDRAEFEWAVTYLIDQPNQKVTVEVEQALLCYVTTDHTAIGPGMGFIREDEVA
ncbi:hypothetical protein [Devosia sp. A449]